MSGLVTPYRLPRDELFRAARSSPRAAQEVDVLDRIGSGQGRPDQLLKVGNVDIVIDHDDPAAPTNTPAIVQLRDGESVRPFFKPFLKVA